MGPAVSGLYSPVTQEKNNLTGKTLDATRKICDEAPNNSLLISERCFDHAGAAARIDAEEFLVIEGRRSDEDLFKQRTYVGQLTPTRETSHATGHFLHRLSCEGSDLS